MSIAAHSTASEKGLTRSVRSHLATAAERAAQGDLVGVLEVDAVDRRQRATQHVVDAAVLMGALDRNHVARVLDHADHGAVAPGIRADRAERPLREVEALLADPDLLLHLA